MSGPHFESFFGMTDDERERFIARLAAEPLDPPRRGFHHEPPEKLPPIADDDEGVGAEVGE